MKPTHRVEWFRRDPGGGTLNVKPAPPLTPAEVQHLITAAAEHAATCDCPAQPDRHREHSHRSRADLVDEALHDVAQHPNPPTSARRHCAECGTTWASDGELRRARHQLTAGLGAPADAYDDLCAACPADLLDGPR